MKFPKVLYVKIEDGGTGPDYFLPEAAVEDLAKIGERCTVAVYRLAGTTTIKGVVITDDIKKQK